MTNAVVHPYYPKAFYDLSWDDSRACAEVVLPLVFDLIGKPLSMCDVGCGNGAMLAVAMDLGVEAIAGFDGEWARGALIIPEKFFHATDLNQPAEMKRGMRYDLCMSLEVAEHLEPESADHFIDTLTSFSDVVLFSAAIPGQGGTQHINEQWTAYWVKLFEQRGYDAFDPIRFQVWDDQRVSLWYRQNIVLFAKHGTRVAGLLDDWIGVMTIVHPEMYMKRSPYFR